MLEGHDISYSRENKSLFSHLSFCLKKGERLVVQGANGSGKSTLLRLIAGLIPPKKETLFWEGESLSPLTIPTYQQSLLYVGHKLCLLPEARIHDQIHHWKRLYKVSEKSLEQALNYWELDHFQHHKISHLSQGQQKRLSLSRCLWLKRSLWILDEPEAGLDQEGQRKLEDLLALHLKEGGEIIHASHHIDPAAAYRVNKSLNSQGGLALYNDNEKSL